MSFRRTSFSEYSLSDYDYDTVKTKPLYGKKTFIWEIESIESVMADGVQRAISCEFEIGHASFSYTNGSSKTNPLPYSKWKLALDLADIEPAITIKKLQPEDKHKIHCYKISMRVMRNRKMEADIISFPNDNLFYEANGLEPRKFTLNKQLDYGCSYTNWMKEVIHGGSLLLKVDFQTCESFTNYPSA